MPDYISQFTGSEIDAAIQKAKDINKTAAEINNNLNYVDQSQSALSTAAVGEIVAKNSNGNLEGTGIINEDGQIFFPKDGRFPSGSIDIGPGITLSENGGFVQNTPHTLDKTYLMVDYEVNKTGTSRPIYWERAAEDTNVVLQSTNTTPTTLSFFERTPLVDSQVNALYLNFAQDYNDVIIEVVSLNTGKAIKYFPNETAWKTSKGGISVTAGVNNILEGFTPISFLNTYNIRFNFKTPVTLMGDGTNPWLAVDRQLITQKGLLLVGEGTGSPDTAVQVRDKLASLTGDARLDASHIKNIPSGGTNQFIQLSDVPNSYTNQGGKYVKVKADASGLEFLNVNPSTPSPTDIRNALESLEGSERLSSDSVNGLAEFFNTLIRSASTVINGGDANG